MALWVILIILIGIMQIYYALLTMPRVKSIGGRTNWRLPQRNELKDELFDSFGNMFTARGWPTSQTYWSSTPDIADYYNVYLDDGRIFSDDRGEFMFVSCVSEF